MKSRFELFKEQLDEAIAAIEDAKLVDIASTGSEDSLDSLVDTSSLLARCEGITAKYQQSKPKIRLVQSICCETEFPVHDVFRSIPNVFVLDDIYPTDQRTNAAGAGNISASDLPGHFKAAGVPRYESVAIESFGDVIFKIHGHLEELGGSLVVVENLHRGFVAHGKIQSQLAPLLEKCFDVQTILLIQNPLDAFFGFYTGVVADSLITEISNYLKEFESAISQFSDQYIFPLDAIQNRNIKEVKRLCDSLELNNSEDFDYSLDSKTVNDLHDNTRICLNWQEIETTFNGDLKSLTACLESVGINLFSPSKIKITYIGSQILNDISYNLLEHVSKGARPVLVVAGMRHSGSTVLFNILRLAIEKADLNLFSTYSELSESLNFGSSKYDVVLVKTHEMRDDVRESADIVITTIRDLRDTVASAKRRDFPMLKRVSSPAEYAKYNRIIYDSWEKYSNYEFVYEHFMRDPEAEIEKVLKLIGLGHLDLKDIARDVMNLPTDQYQVTLLSSTHITDPDRKESYFTTLDMTDIEKINHQHKTWLRSHGYDG